MTQYRVDVVCPNAFEVRHDRLPDLFGSHRLNHYAQYEPAVLARLYPCIERPLVVYQLVWTLWQRLCQLVGQEFTEETPPVQP